MSLDDWILALHVLSAFALVAAMVLFWVLSVGDYDLWDGWIFAAIVLWVIGVGFHDAPAEIARSLPSQRRVAQAVL